MHKHHDMSHVIVSNVEQVLINILIMCNLEICHNHPLVSFISSTMQQMKMLITNEE